MSVRFHARSGLIVVPVRLWGPSGSAVFRFALDTGATTTTTSFASLVALGYDPAATPDRVQVTTGSNVEFAPLVVVERVRSLDDDRTNFPVLGHTLPPSAGVDGLLGLDFLRGQSLIVDFRAGEVTLS